MNSEETKAAIEVMQAAVDGKPIQWRPRHLDNWEDIDHDVILWSWDDDEYRVKPRRPREFWLVIHSQRLFDATPYPVRQVGVSSEYEQIHVREVLEDE